VCAEGNLPQARSHSRLPIHRLGHRAFAGRRVRPKTALSASPVPPESRMLKFLGSTIGIIFLIGLVVTIILLKAIF